MELISKKRKINILDRTFQAKISYLIWSYAQTILLLSFLSGIENAAHKKHNISEAYSEPYF